MVGEGVINIDKPADWTSHDVVAKIRGVLKLKKVGHTGTLDPQATGVLPICFGKGTKIVPFLMDAEKDYDVVLRLGQETDTEDATGRATASCDVPPAVSGAVLETLQSFVGTYVQMPPMYSAVKVGGVPLYKSARLGKTVERTPRAVFIRSIQLHRVEQNDVSFSVSCSKGTYVRTLCADIGRKLGVGGHLLALRRTRSGIFNLRDSVTLEAFCHLCAEGTWEKEVYSINEVLSALPALWVKEGHVRKVMHGAPIGLEAISRWDLFKKGESLRFLDPRGNLLAIGTTTIPTDGLELKSGAGRAGVSSGSIFKMKTVLSEATEKTVENIVR